VPLTRDHVPARNLFPTPRPHNLITVPQCLSCKAGLGEDEEYFVVAMISDAAPYNAEAEAVREHLYPEIISPGRQRLADCLKRSTKTFNFQTEGGVYLGRKPMLRLDVPRVNRVLDKIVRGLYFCESHRVVSSDMVVTVEILPPPELREDLAFQITLEAETKWRGNKVFRWKRAFAQDNPRAGMWLMSFYRRTLAQATITAAPTIAAPEESKTDRDGYG
jgi:hypothetical protein